MQSTNDLLNLLRKIKNFSELEKVLANISNDKVKGDLFELFCQVYLKVIYKKQVFKSIQLFKDVDASILQRLNLRLGKDFGIDIVAITDSNDLWTIQVKFRQSDQLTWTELSTFKASSEKATFTMLMSNVSKINHPHNVLTGFSSILRNEFEALTEDDFSNIKAFLKGQAIKSIVYSPRPHQIEAINSAIKHFKTNNLGQMIHACGTGKTLTSLWIKEALKPKNTIVYVPSLSLLKQTLEEWTKHKSSDFSIKCVCSDQSVSTTAQELDETIVDVTELGVPVTTNAKEIAEFLKTDKDKIIFSTYQSAPVILEAIKSLPKFSFDFGVFDEAHRTASKSEQLFTKSLNTPVQKKLFMTATPRLYAPHLKSRAKEEDILLCSMDDVTIYGEIFHEIKFGKAIELNLLSDYKIKIITVTNDEIKELIDRRYWIKLLGKEITADDLAKVWALLKSFNEANHVISFHSRISRSKEFQSLVEKTIELLKNSKKEVEDVKTYHISGAYPTYQRSKILSEFIAQKKSLVTNARCLTEGVDVPAIDGVYFVDPKQNIIDIVQAVGRAIRKKPTKYGYIIIPVFIKDEADAEEIIESSAFRQVWDVVEAMKDQDARLSHIIEELQELKGKKKFGSLNSREQAEERALKTDLGNIFDLTDSILPKNIDLVHFVEQINVRTLEIVGRSWDERFGEYKGFREMYKYEPKSESKIESEKSIGSWVLNQRGLYKKKKLQKDRINKLNFIGFVWDPFETSWEQQFKDYKLFKEKENREPSYLSNVPKEKLLVRWVSDQRENCKKNRLSKSHLDKLNSIGFTWDQLEASWDQSFRDYQIFKEKYDREPSQSSKDQSEIFINRWVGNQRKNYKKNKLSKDHLDKLKSITFVWSLLDSSWDDSFDNYIKFKKEHNKEPNNNSKDKFEKLAATWATRQRVSYKKNELSKSRVAKLDSVDFIWDLAETSWDNNFKGYKSFKKKQGRFPSEESKDKSESFLGSWAGGQRQKYKKNKLPKDRIDKLNLIGFVWDPLELSWNQEFEEYQEFKKKFNKEPTVYSKSESEKFIANWAARQRIRYNKNKLSQDKIDNLNSISFTWDQLESSWNKLFEDYKNFKERNNHEPSAISKENYVREIGRWAGQQRKNYKKNKLSKERIDRLESIGFVWDLLTTSWENLFESYKRFKEKYNREPSSESKNKSENLIGSWVLHQRNDFKNGMIRKDRVKKLNEAGFIWQFLEKKWDQSFKDYQDFKKKNNREPSQISKDESEIFLERWARQQRVNYEKNILSKAHIDKLESMGFVWDLLEASWNLSLENYKNFKEKYSREPINGSKDVLEKEIARWVSRQRDSYKKNNISKERIDKLTLAGFVWNGLETSWDQLFQNYKTFKEKHNREPREKSKDASEKCLAKWVGTQRKSYSAGKISKERIDKLNFIGFQWTMRIYRFSSK